MVNAPNEATPRATLWMMYVSFAIAPLVYAVVAFVLRPASVPGPSPAAPAFADPLVLGLGMAALGAATAGLVLPRVLAARASASAAATRALTDDDRARLLRVPLTVCWSLFDAVAICGFVLVFLGRPASWVLPFCGVALALLALHPPTAARLEGLLAD